MCRPHECQPDALHLGVRLAGGQRRRVDSECEAVRGTEGRAGYARVGQMVDVSLVAVSAANWWACAALRVEEDQRHWVADVTYYLCLCTYGDTWHPLAIEVENEVVGFLMWGVDDDESRWIGGLVIDAAHQRHGVARAAITEAIRLLIAQPGCTGVALSYNATNQAARSLYAGLGFVETGETVDDGAELVSRLSLSEARKLTAGELPDV